MLKQMPQARLDPRLLRDGLARPARPGRVLGRVPGDPQRLQPGRPAPRQSEPRVPHVCMVIAAVGTVLAAGYLLWLYQRTAFGEPNAGVRRPTRTHRPLGRRGRQPHDAPRRHPRRHASSSGSPGRRCCRILVLGVYPQLLFKIIDPAVDQLTRGVREVTDARVVARRRQRLRVAARSTTTRSRPRSCSAVGICLVLLVDLFVAEQQALDHGDARRASCCSARCCRSSRSA